MEHLKKLDGRGGAGLQNASFKIAMFKTLDDAWLWCLLVGGGQNALFKIAAKQCLKILMMLDFDTWFWCLILTLDFDTWFWCLILTHDFDAWWRSMTIDDNWHLMFKLGFRTNGQTMLTVESLRDWKKQYISFIYGKIWPNLIPQCNV